MKGHFTSRKPLIEKNRTLATKLKDHIKKLNGLFLPEIKYLDLGTLSFINTVDY